MKNIYIVRHGQSQSNAGGEALPNAEIPLTESGRQQASDVAEWLSANIHAEIQSIGISRYIRTLQTAQPMLDKTGMEATLIDNLQEFNGLSFLTIEGTSFEERLRLSDEYWERSEIDYIDGSHFPVSENLPEYQAESFTTFAERAQIVLSHFQTMEEGTHIVFAHGMMMSMLLWQILNFPVNSSKAMQNFRNFELSIRPKNTEVYLLQINDEDALPAMTKVRTIDTMACS